MIYVLSCNIKGIYHDLFVWMLLISTLTSTAVHVVIRYFLAQPQHIMKSSMMDVRLIVYVKYSQKSANILDVS